MAPAEDTMRFRHLRDAAALADDDAAFGDETLTEGNTVRSLGTAGTADVPQVRPLKKLRSWKLQSVHRAQREITDFLDRELPNTLNRLLDVSGPFHCRRRKDAYLPGHAALHYRLDYELAERTVSKELIFCPILEDRDALGDTLPEDTEVFAWDVAAVHNGESRSYRFEASLEGEVPDVSFVMGDGERVPVGVDLARRLRSFFRNPLRPAID